MPKPRKRKQPKCKPKSVKDDDALSGWTIEPKPVEPVRLRSVSPELWRGNLTRLREDFLYARKQHGPLRCPLFQDSTSKADAQQPPFDMHAGHVGFHSQLYHDFRWHVTADRKPIYLKHPIVDVKGTPIVDSRGRGLLCEMRTGREWSYCGTSPASAQFRELAERAGRALLGSARHTIAWIPPDTLFTQMDEHRWLWAAFDLAWQGRHPSLRAERKTWFRPREPIPNVESNVVYVPYDRQQLRSMREGALASVFNFPEEWTDRLPGYFISELPDLFQASADLIDLLLDMAAQSGETENKKSFAKLGDWNALSDRQRNCMRALLELRAFDADSRQGAGDIAVKAEGRGANVNGFKEPLSDLVFRGLAESKTGRKGGYWLTRYGHELLAVGDADLAADNPSS